MAASRNTTNKEQVNTVADEAPDAAVKALRSVRQKMGGRRDFENLSFLKLKEPAGSGIDYWSVEPTGSYTIDYDAGKKLGDEFLEYVGREPTVGNSTLLGCIVRAIASKGAAGGVELGFFRTVGTAAMGAAVILKEFGNEDKGEVADAATVSDAHIDRCYDTLETLNVCNHLISSQDFVGEKTLGSISWLLGSMATQVGGIIELLEKIQHGQAEKNSAAAIGPDQGIIQLGKRLAESWEAERLHDLDTPLNRQADGETERLYEASSAIVSEIENTPAQSIQGLKVKAQAIRWCYHDDDIDLGGDDTTDLRLARQIIKGVLDL